ncbi:MAG: CRISPR-associated endonuclease Cas1 [Tannerellaceae bacterium]|nr:CRISPR-associated endonuclease Cas1 [Tannerellaceae bacterium]
MAFNYYYNALCKPVTLYSAWKAVKLKNSAGGIDGQSVTFFEENLKVNLAKLRRDLIDKSWNPQPYLQIEIRKNESEKRKLGLLSVRDKIVQQAIKSLIEPKIDKVFLNNSYGYRPGRGPVKAVQRLQYLMRQTKKGWVAKLDIDDFFDSINHERLFTRLRNFLKDEEIIRLIELAVKTGMINKQMKWNELTSGVPQGAVLSPLLSNFYLHPFDQAVVSKIFGYVRYADDFVICLETKDELFRVVQLIKRELERSFTLKLNEPVISELESGIEFLGILVKPKGFGLSEKKMKDLKSRISSVEMDGAEFSTKSLETLQGIRNYYGRLLMPSLLKELDTSLIDHIHTLIHSNHTNIPNKTALQTGLKSIEFITDEITLSKRELLKNFTEMYLKEKPVKGKAKIKADNKKLIRQCKREYQKRENEGCEMVVRTPGSFIGKTNRGITVKLKGTPQNTKPTHALKHIIVTGQGVSISSNAISYCITNHIPIDFFDSHSKHYASVLSPVTMDGLLWQQQALLPLKKKIGLASRIISAKLKNQRSLVKYYHKYHKDVTGVLTSRYPELILRLEECINRVKMIGADSTNEDYAAGLIGQEAVGSVAYWEYIRLLIADDGIDFPSRQRQGATDLVNSMLNYGYAILYARIWHAVLSQKLNPSLSVLHVFQPGKPTLIYDIIELFRSQAVDRVVISLIQKGPALKLQNGLLHEETKHIYTENLLERLNRYETYRGESIRFADIIKKQVHELAEFISGRSSIFKPYLSKW